MYNKTHTNMIRTVVIKFTETKITQITSNGCTDKLCYIHRVLNSNENKQITVNNLYYCHNTEWENRHGRIHTASFYLYKVQKQFYTVVKSRQQLTFREKRRGSELERDFWGAGNVFFLTWMVVSWKLIFKVHIYNLCTFPYVSFN